MLIPFPNSTTRTYIHIFVLANARGHLSRVKTDALITAMLRGYGLSKLHLDGYTVHVAEPIETDLGVFPITHIEAKYWGEGDRCPKCGGKPGYLEGDEVITAACMACGCVFKFKDTREGVK